MQVENLVIDNEEVFWDGIHIDVAGIEQTTEKAVLLGLDHQEGMWVPKSQLCLFERPDGRYVAAIPHWADKRNQNAKRRSSRNPDTWIEAQLDAGLGRSYAKRKTRSH